MIYEKVRTEREIDMYASKGLRKLTIFLENKPVTRVPSWTERVNLFSTHNVHNQLIKFIQQIFNLYL